jgi:hypothetical protein
MNLEQFLSTKPREMDAGKYLSLHIKGLYSRHTQYLQTASETNNPLQPDSVQWLLDTQAFMREVQDSNIHPDSVATVMLGRLLSLNVPRECVVLRDLARKSNGKTASNNLVTAWSVG